MTERRSRTVGRRKDGREPFPRPHYSCGQRFEGKFSVSPVGTLPRPARLCRRLFRSFYDFMTALGERTNGGDADPPPELILRERPACPSAVSVGVRLPHSNEGFASRRFVQTHQLPNPTSSCRNSFQVAGGHETRDPGQFESTASSRFWRLPVLSILAFDKDRDFAPAFRRKGEILSISGDASFTPADAAAALTTPFNLGMFDGRRRARVDSAEARIRASAGLQKCRFSMKANSSRRVESLHLYECW